MILTPSNVYSPPIYIICCHPRRQQLADAGPRLSECIKCVCLLVLVQTKNEADWRVEKFKHPILFCLSLINGPCLHRIFSWSLPFGLSRHVPHPSAWVPSVERPSHVLAEGHVLLKPQCCFFEDQVKVPYFFSLCYLMLLFDVVVCWLCFLFPGGIGDLLNLIHMVFSTNLRLHPSVSVVLSIACDLLSIVALQHERTVE